MNPRREIRGEEKNLITFLLEKLNLRLDDFPINENVEEYEGGVMGSIGLGNPEISPYIGNLIQAKYIDIDSKEIVITLTKDTNNKLLDLDFWKVDFSKLIKYPSSKSLMFEECFLPKKP